VGRIAYRVRGAYLFHRQGCSCGLLHCCIDCDAMLQLLLRREATVQPYSRQPYVRTA
jgi:hypothetical protein